MSAAVVVYVHGLWMPGDEAVLLRRSLWRERGLRVEVFRYASLRQSLEQITAALRDFVASFDAPEVHLIGHSLGGAVILQYLQRYRMRQSGRVVFMGAPVVGCRSAQAFSRWAVGRRLLGPMASEILLGPCERRWDLARELGVIAGTLPLGFGQLLHPLWGLGEPSDGTVAVSETRLPGAKAHLSLPVSHMGLLLSPRVAYAAGQFLQYGSFAA